MNLLALKTVITSGAGRAVLVLAKNSPAILIGGGVVGVVGSFVLGCKATLKVDEVLDEAAEKVEKIEEAHVTMADKYSDADYKKDLLIVKVQTGIEMIKLYAPSVILGVVSIGLILKSHNILSRRNVALMAAYKAIEKSFGDYRKRVIEEFGVDADRIFKYGIRKETKTIIDENGVETTEEQIVGNPNGSVYAVLFDESNKQWSKMPGYNQTYLTCQQNYANDLFRKRGHVLLNDIYDVIGVERTPTGAITGWVKGVGDQYISFDLLDGTNIKDANPSDRSFWLDFNVTGIVYDMI